MTMELSSDQLIDIYVKMWRIRLFEEKVGDLCRRGVFRGDAHLYLRQEAIAVGVCAALRPTDYITSTHRNHGHCIAKGGDVKLMMAEVFGKETGYCKGRGGEMHIADYEHGFLGGNGIVGGSIPTAAGAALATKLRKSGEVAVAFFGDGSSNEGTFHETLNMAGVWKLPVIFVCENNKYAISVPISSSLAIENISDRAASYGFPGVTVDGQDVLAVYEAAQQAVARARKGEGPTLIECKTHRLDGHCITDTPMLYLSREEVEAWDRDDPIMRYRDELFARGVLDEEKEKALLDAERMLIDEAVRFAEESAEPAPDTLYENLYAEPLKITATPTAKDDREHSFRDAINEGLREEMARDSRVFVLGEDVGKLGGVYRVTHDLQREFGEERVRDTPMSEAAMVGLAAGAALAGFRPVAEIMSSDWSTLAMDQLVNVAAKARFLYGGQAAVPLVVRIPQGAGHGGSAQHSQSFEAWYIHVPGLQVVMPSTPFDAKGLLKTAIRSDNPVIFIEHKLLYATRGLVPRDEYLIPIGKAEVKRRGRDITIFAYGLMVHKALAAAERLRQEGIEAEVIDPRTLKPLDLEPVLESVRKTKHLVVVSEGCYTGSYASDVVARVIDEAFEYLDAPPKRVATADVPIPFGYSLEMEALPSEEKIQKAVHEVLAK